MQLYRVPESRTDADFSKKAGPVWDRGRDDDGGADGGDKDHGDEDGDGV